MREQTLTFFILILLIKVAKVAENQFLRKLLSNTRVLRESLRKIKRTTTLTTCLTHVR